MSSLRVCTFFGLAFICVLHASHGQEPNEVCVLAKKCPDVGSILRSQQYESKICDYEGRYPKIWCRIPCVTPAQQKGYCVLADDCSPFQQLAQKLDKHDEKARIYLRRFVCAIASNYKQHYVCCSPETADVSVTRQPPTVPTAPTKIATEPPVTRPAVQEQCGVQNDEFKIVGGTIAGLGEFPWLAQLQYRSRGRLVVKCGGSLIGRRYVLTAAHCVDESASELVNVILGEHNVTSAIDCFHNYCAPPPKSVRVESIIAHPRWLNARNRFYHDIALVRLAEDVQYSAFIQPICLPKRDYTASINDPFIVAGWGQTETQQSSDVKRQAKISLKDNFLCLNTISLPLVAEQMCVGGDDKDSCKGDSGGPLMRVLKIDGYFVWQLAGIVSLGYDSPCGSIGRPGIYTFVPMYVDWIYRTMRP